MRGEGAPPRASAPPDGVATRADLARELTLLRTRSGLTVRELARRLDAPVATVGDYFSGRHLPGPAQLRLFGELLRECGVGERELDAWVEALTRVRLASDGRVVRAPAPYRGLESFQLDDADLFFGREAATEEVIGRLRAMREDARPAEIGSCMLLLIGPSGAGKSSLLRAGVAARARSGALDSAGAPFSVAVMTPGDAPLARLRAALADVDAERRLIVIDQLEEMFALDGSERAGFLTELARLRAPRTLVLAGLRSDFYESAMREPMLLDALRQRQLLIGPMTEAEVRRAILEPAARAGIRVEEGLVDLVLADLAPGSPSGFAHETGALPLLSHALLATWERGQGNQLETADYRRAGGLRGAISQTAEELYLQLDEHQQAVARRMFCRLVRVDGEAPLTRRRIARDELQESDDASGRDGARRPGAPEALDRFVAARLITLDGETVELSHEAVLLAWPRLAGWIAEDRDALRLHHELTDAAHAWAAAGRDESLLPRGARLQAISEWAGSGGRVVELNRAEREFLEAGVELAEAERRAARRRTRRMQQLLAVVAALALAAAALAAIAFHAQSDAQRARDEALSRQVAIEADSLARSDPSLAMQLGLAADRIWPTTQATSTLLGASASEMPTRLLGPTGPTSIALGGGELAVAYSSTDAVRLYSLAGARPRPIATVSAGASPTEVFAVALSADGSLLAVGTTTGKVFVWSLARAGEPRRLASLAGFPGGVTGLAFAPRGGLLAAAGQDGTVREWSLATPSRPVLAGVLATASHASLEAVGYSPDGRELAAVGAGGRLVVWSARARARPLAQVTAAPTTLTSVAYSPNGQTLVAGGQDARVYIWRVARSGVPRRRLPSLGGFTSWVDSLAFSRDGRYLAAGDSDNSLRVWSTAQWTHLATLHDVAPVTGVAITPDGRRLVTADEDGTTRIWSFPPPDAVRAAGSVFSIDYTRNGGELAAVSGGPAGAVALWNVADPWRPEPLAPVALPSSFGPAAGVEALSPDGRLIAVGDEAGAVRLLVREGGAGWRSTGPPLGGATAPIEQLVLSPDARVLSVGDAAGRIQMWDVADPAKPTRLTTIEPRAGAGSIFGLVYSPNGRLLAAARENGKVWLWRVSEPGRPRLLAVLGGFASYAYTVAFTPNGRTLIAGGAPDTVRLWDVSEPRRPRRLGPPLAGPTSTVYDISVSPRGDTLAASTTGGDVWLWNIADPGRPRVLADLTAASGPVFDVTFSPDGSMLAASGADQTLHFWDYRPGQVAARVCERAGTPITKVEWAQYVQGAAYDPPCRGGGGSGG
ncbi:MAG: nSTAND1 domain-containing NTPase [Solirubrobacteraceae bacterium]